MHLFVLSTLELTLVIGHINAESERALKKNADVIVSVVENGASMEYLKAFLGGYSKSANRNVIIINNKCEIIMKSTVADNFDRGIKNIPEQYCKRVLSNKENIIKGTLGDIYRYNMFTLQIPIVDAKDNKNVIGAVMLSMPYPEMRSMENRIFRISIMSTILVVILTFLFSFTLSKRLSTPIKQISVTANKFAKQDFSQRIDLKQNAYNICEMRELADTFNHMADELEKSENIRNNFISDVSHELRTPITTIGGFVDGILDGAIPEEKQKDYLLIVKNEVHRLSKLINNFLDITRLQNDKDSLEFKDFDIAEMIRLSLISISDRLEEKNIEVDLEFESSDMFVNADFDSIKRVITNLLDNAVKFTNENGKIIVSAETKHKETFIKIYNTGVGISEEDRPYIFKRFYKADKSRSINKEGTGIGLFIVQDIITKHGKKITLDSKEGEYACFTFNLTTGKIIKQ